MALNAQSKLLLEAAQRYAQAISPEALAVLDARGICEVTAAKFQLGTITDPINGHEMYEGWISIPYITASGSCVGFKFRRVDEGKPKYGSPTGQKAHLYNVSDITIMKPYIVVCEGELDTDLPSLTSPPKLATIAPMGIVFASTEPLNPLFLRTLDQSCVDIRTLSYRTYRAYVRHALGGLTYSPHRLGYS